MSLTIHCPECTAGLKLPDRSFLGRKGKCPKCAHRFVLEEPDEVELELADPEPPPAAPSVGDAPLMGTSAKWVPDAPTQADPVFPLANAGPAAPVFPPNNSTDQPIFPQPDAFPQVGSPDAAVFPEVATEAGPGSLNFEAPSKGEAEPTSLATGGKLGRRKRKRGLKGPIVIGVGTALLVACMGGLWWQQQQQKQVDAQQAAAAEQPQVNEDWEQEKEELADSNIAATQLSPTSGTVIPLDYMPFTPHLICHLRPAEIWAPTARSQEFVALTFNLGTWMSEQILDITRFEPQDIEELTFALNFGARTSAPEVAAIVRLKAEYPTSELQMNRFQGQVRPDLDAQVFEGDRYSYLLIDNKTFAVAPAALSRELGEAKSYPRQPTIELEVLQKESDRSRWMSVLFDVENLDTHRQYIFGEDMQAFADQFVLWFGKDVRTVSWSLDLSSDNLFMETLLHPHNESSALRAERYMKSQLSELPTKFIQLSRFMQPGSAGYRKLIGRFPAMLKATVLGTSTHVGPAYVRMVTLLPAKAAANLAAASLTTWNQSLVTDFTGPAPVAAKGPKLPDRVADRLKMPVIVDFRRMPLQEAFAYVADEIKTPININGDALKLAGMTQNMPQTYDLGEIPAVQAIDAMLRNPDYKGMLVIVVDEANKSIQLTTRAVAESTGLEIYPTP